MGHLLSGIGVRDSEEGAEAVQGLLVEGAGGRGTRLVRWRRLVKWHLDHHAWRVKRHVLDVRDERSGCERYCLVCRTMYNECEQCDSQCESVLFLLGLQLLQAFFGGLTSLACA